MLAYLLVRELAKCWRHLELTAEEGLDELKSLCTTRVTVKAVAMEHAKYPSRLRVSYLYLAVGGASVICA
jgi:hypothetical protein